VPQEKVLQRAHQNHKRSQNNEQEKPEIIVNALRKGKPRRCEENWKGALWSTEFGLRTVRKGFSGCFFPTQYSLCFLCAWPLPVFVHELERNVTFHVEHTNRKKKGGEKVDHLVFL